MEGTLCPRLATTIAALVLFPPHITHAPARTFRVHAPDRQWRVHAPDRTWKTDL